MMQASPYPAQPSMGPGHPGMAHGHPMQVQHGGHMGQPNPMMAGMHPAMSGPQVTQGGPMASGMPPNPGTPAPGGPMQNPMAMAHLGGQGPMFHGNHPQMNMGQMSMNANMVARQRAMNMMQGGGQLNHNMMALQGMHGLNPAQIQQMKAMQNMPMQQVQHMTPQQQQMLQQQQQYAHQQRMMAQHAVQQQQMMTQQRQQAQQQAQQQHANQQAQMNRNQEPTTTAPPQPQPTPAPQAPPQTQPPPQPNVQTPQQTPQQKPQQPQPPTTQPQQQNAPTPQIKQGDDDEIQAKQDIVKQQMIMEMAQQSQQDFSGQCILQLLSYYDTLAGPQRPMDIEYWQDVMNKYHSVQGSVRLQVLSNKTQNDKSFQLQYPILARFYHSHYKNGIRKILMQSFEHAQEPLPNGGYRVTSKKMYLTYEYHDGVRVTAHGQLSVNFDEMQKIEHLYIVIKGWTEYIPRSLVDMARGSPEQTRQSPKLSKKNLPKGMQQRTAAVPVSPVTEWGLPERLIQFLEIAEVMTTMGSLMEYYCNNQVSGPREALARFNQENAQMNQARMQNMNAAAANGQVQFQNPRMGMNPPNQFQSPAFAHLNLPQNQQSPHMNHTPSPTHGQGGVTMVHQMSAQGSNLSGSQGPSTNTSPNVTNKRRRPSAIKEEDAAQAAGNEKTKPSPRVGKRQKGQQA